MNVPIAAHPERLPQLLADDFYSLAKTLEDDREVRRIVSHARESLAALSWARFARRHEQSDKAFRLRRRHQGHGHTTVKVLPQPASESTAQREYRLDTAARSWSGNALAQFRQFA